MFIALVLGLTLMVTVNRPLQALTGAVLVLLGLPAYRVFERRRATPTATHRMYEPNADRLK